MFKTLKKMYEGGPNKSIEAVGFHYAKSMMHRFEMATGLETDPSDIVNEMINSTRKVGGWLQKRRHGAAFCLMVVQAVQVIPSGHTRALP